MTSINDDIVLLRKVPMFASMDGGKLKLLAYTSEKLGFEDGEIVFRQGSTDSDAFFILEGAADVLTGDDGAQVKVAHLPLYALFGEISAFCDIPRTATVRADGHLVVLRIPKGHFLELIGQSPEIALQIIRVLALRISDTTAELSAALRKQER